MTHQDKTLHILLSQQLQNESANSGHPSLQTQQAAAQRYKTELCRSFQENGTCKYGDKCQFAHGQQETRSMHRHPKYKSELCRTFHAQGYCPYGPRCHFVHEINKPIVTQQPWINTNSSGSWGKASPTEPGLLMCALNLSGSNSSIFSDFNDWNSTHKSTSTNTSSSGSSSTHSSSPRSISPSNGEWASIEDLEFSTTMMVNQILNNINENSGGGMQCF